MCTSRSMRGEAGFTMLELVVFIVIVSVGLAGVLSVLNQASLKSVDPFPIKQALAVAEGFMDEISLKPYANPTGGFSGAATQANRAQFDDVSDYNGYSQVGVYSQAGGSALAGLGSYSVAISVAATTLNGTAAKLITVTVTDPKGDSYALAGYRTSYF